MRATSIKQKTKAFSLLELFVVLATLAVLVALVLPRLAGSTKSPVIMCINNLRQVGLGFIVFATDHTNQLPMQTSVTNGGSMDYVGSGTPATYFQTVSNYLGGYWGVLLCPSDKTKQQATKGAAPSDRNISYFISVDATPVLTNAILAGDRNLEVAGQPVAPGLFILTTNAAVGWTREMHKIQRNGVWVGCGNLLFVDGHVQRFQADLPTAIQRQGLATNRLAVP